MTEQEVREHIGGLAGDYKCYNPLISHEESLILHNMINKPEPHEIGYDDCANALLKMWMDNVLTDGEYYRIADKLNKKWGKTESPEPFKGVTE